MNFEWIGAEDPRWGAVLHALLWVAILGWVWRLPPEELWKGAPDRSRWRDLRWWVVPLAATQVGLYFLF